MGREVRRVPLDWQHPRDERTGDYIPMLDEVYVDAIEKWIADYWLWKEGKHPDQISSPDITAKYQHLWEWDEGPPKPDYHRPAYESEPVGYQVYENTSEGTPMSPVFASQDEMIDWLVSEGYNREAAVAFAEHGYAPSFVMAGGRIVDGISAYTAFEEPSDDSTA